MIRSKISPDPSSYEAAVQELEGLIVRLEAGQMPLEDMLGAYQRGNELLRYCETRLQALQQQVSVLDAGPAGPGGSDE